MKMTQMGMKMHQKMFDESIGEFITKDRLTAITLYTDFTALSSDFTSTFRKNGL